MVRKNWPWIGKAKQTEVVEIPLDKVIRSPYQPRIEFDENELIELAQSIRSYGLIQPIIVRQNKDGYQLVAGERRYRACCMLGMQVIPAVVHEMDDEKAAAVSLIENIQRKELNYFEEAHAYNVLISAFGMTQEELARKIGKSQSAIANKLRILKLADTVQDIIDPGVITERHARALLKISSTETQLELVKQIYEKELNVKETEELVDKLKENNIPGNNQKEGKQNVSMIIRDARIFINTIRETVKRGKQTGVDINIEEKDGEEEYEINIKIGKSKKRLRKMAENNKN